MANWYEDNYPFKNFSEPLTEFWILNNFNKASTRGWLESGLKENDYDFAEWLAQKGITPDYFLEFRDYQNKQEEMEKEKSTKTISPDKLVGPGLEILDLSSLSQQIGFDQEKAKRRIELYKRLDQGQRLRTKITAVDEMYWGSLRFTIADHYRDWSSEDQLINFFTDNIEPYTSWEVGDLIEIDLERLNSEKCSIEPLKEQDKHIVSLIEKVEKKKSTVSKKANQNAKLKAKVSNLEWEIKDLKNKLAQKEEIIKQLRESNDCLQQEVSKSVENFRFIV